MASWRDRKPAFWSRTASACFSRSFVGLAWALTAGVPGGVLAQTLHVAPDENTIFRFAGPQGGPFTAQTGLNWTLSDADSIGLAFGLSPTQPWLRATPAGGNFGILGNQTREVTASLVLAESQALAPGIYIGSVSFVNLDTGAGNSTREVELTVSPGSFAVTPAFVNGVATQFGPNPAPVTVTLTGVGNLDLNYSLTALPSTWFSVSKTFGTVPAGGIDSFVVSFNAQGLEPGNQDAVILVQNTTNGAGTTQLPVTLTVIASGTGVVTLTPDTDIVVAGPAELLTPPAVQSNELRNSGNAPVTWQATSSEDWISVSPAGGSLSPAGAAGGLDRQGVSIRVNQGINALPAGSHVGLVTFKNVTTGVPIATRVVRVSAQPVLSLATGLVGGSISVSPVGSVLSAAQQIYNMGQVVTLTASAEDGFEFDGWVSDSVLDDPLANPLVVTMDASKSFGATFTPILRTLNLGYTGSGTGTVTASPTATQSENELITKYVNGVAVMLTAEPDAGASFVGWSGNVPPGHEFDNPLIVLMDRDRTLTARFDSLVSLVIAVAGEGEVSVDPELAAYPAGSVVTLTATPAEGFEFQGWSGDAAGSESVITLRLDEDLAVQAAFVEEGATAPLRFQLNVDVEGDGTVSPSSGEFESGDSVLLVATPEVGSVFMRWEGDADGDDLTVMVVMDQDRTVRAVFEEDGTGEPRPSPGSGGACGAVGMLLPAMLAGCSLLRGRRRGLR